MIRTAMAVFLERLVTIRLPLEEEQIGEWMKLLELLVADNVKRIQETAAEAARIFFATYFEEMPQALDATREKYVKMVRALNEELGTAPGESPGERENWSKLPVDVVTVDGLRER